MKKYSVLTYVFGDYENLHEIDETDPDAEYICVTDNENLKSSTWRIILDKGPKSYNSFDKVCMVRYNPFKYCNTDVVVKVDGSIKIKKSLSPIIDEFNNGNYETCVMIHPARSILEEEYKAWISIRGYDYNHALEVITQLRMCGHNPNYRGLYQLCFSIQRKTGNVLMFNEMAYSLVRNLGLNNHCDRLDQTLFSFVLNKNFSDMAVMAVDEDIVTNSDYMDWCIHGTDEKIPRKTNCIPTYLFNNKIDVFKF